MSESVHSWSQVPLLTHWNLGPSKSGAGEGLLGRFLEEVLMSIEVETFKSSVAGILFLSPQIRL